MDEIYPDGSINEHRKAEEQWMEDTKTLLTTIADKMTSLEKMYADHMKEWHEDHMETKDISNKAWDAISEMFPGMTKAEAMKEMVKMQKDAMSLATDEMKKHKTDFNPFRKEKRDYKIDDSETAPTGI